MFIYEDDPQPECYDCNENKAVLKDMRYWFQGILDQLFGLEEFSHEDLFYYINELAISLRMGIPEKSLAVVRKNRTVELGSALDQWKKDSVEYLKTLANTGS